jgi:hypothetical protein
VLAASLCSTALLLPREAAADDGFTSGASVSCAPGYCDVEASRTVKTVGGRSPSTAPRPYQSSRKLAEERPASATGHTVPLPQGWEYAVVKGVGVMPRFVGSVATKKPSAGQGALSDDAVMERAVKQLRLPEPVIRTSPDAGVDQVVRVPTWLWVDRSGWKPVSTSVAVEGVRVTATARPVRAVWSMGEGGSVVCRGPGTPYSDAVRPDQPSPDCGYTYRRTSRSAPGGAFRVVVRVVWDVTWQGAGKTGEVHGIATSAQRQLVVDEVQAVITG